MRPMLAKAVAELPRGREWTYEVKWDGYRLITVKEGRICGSPLAVKTI